MLRKLLSKSLFHRSFLSLPLYPLTTTSTQSKKIPNFYEINPKLYCEVGHSILACYNCKMLAELFLKNLSSTSDYHISFAMYHIYNYRLELDEHFYHSFLPIVKEFVRNMNRENNRTLADIVSHAGWCSVEDNGLWDLFEQKLLGEKLYRYFSLEQLANVAHGLATAQKGSKEFFDVVENVVVKHRLALEEEVVEKLKDAFEMKKLGSKVLFSVLEEPGRDVESLIGKKVQKEIK